LSKGIYISNYQNGLTEGFLYAILELEVERALYKKSFAFIKVAERNPITISPYL